MCSKIGHEFHYEIRHAFYVHVVHKLVNHWWKNSLSLPSVFVFNFLCCFEIHFVTLWKKDCFDLFGLVLVIRLAMTAHQWLGTRYVMMLLSLLFAWCVSWFGFTRPLDLPPGREELPEAEFSHATAHDHHDPPLKQVVFKATWHYDGKILELLCTYSVAFLGKL